MEGVNYVHVVQYKSIEEGLYNRLEKLGLIPNEVRKNNVGKSDYSKHTIQPWSIWLDYDLNAWDADMIIYNADFEDTLAEIISFIIKNDISLRKV